MHQLDTDPGPLPMGKGGKVTSIFANASVDATDDTMPDGMIAQHAVVCRDTSIVDD